MYKLALILASVGLPATALAAATVDCCALGLLCCDWLPCC